VSKEASPWNKDAAALLNQFFETATGQLFLAHMASGRPALLTNHDNVNAVAIRASEVAGYERAINKIFSLAVPPVEEHQNHNPYPDLDNEAAWDDKNQPKNT
jgi:hypothetical protein